MLVLLKTGAAYLAIGPALRAARLGFLLDDAAPAAVVPPVQEGFRPLSRDFAESLKEDPSAGEIHLLLHEHATGPFADTGAKIKNVYIVRRT